MYKKAIVFCNGDLADVSRIRTYIDANTLLVGCDGGTSHILSLKRKPHVVIGDFDSISSKVLRVLKGHTVEYIRYPRDKMHTDTELGLMLAIERGARDIIITGIRGTATDHLLANLFLLAKKKYASVNITIIEGNEEMRLVRRHVRVKGKKGEILSLIAIGGNASGITTKGLFYPLKNATIRSGSARGVRNQLIGKYAEVSLKKGALFVIHQRN